MSPIVSRASKIVTALGACAAIAVVLATCGGPDVPPRKRVTVRDAAGVDPVGPMRRSEQRIASETRDAFTQVVGEPLELRLAAQGRAKVRTAAALLVPDDVEVDPETAITFHLEWEQSGVFDSQHGVDAKAGDAVKRWTPLELDALQPLSKRSTLTLVARSTKPLPPGLRVAWAVPEVEGYVGAPLGVDVAKKDAKRPNVLFLTVDTLRSDHLKCYGYERDTSPHVDALAARGVLFEQAQSSAPWTLPSYGSTFTGLDPGRHCAGLVRERQQKFGTGTPCTLKGPVGQSQPLREGVATLAQLFAEAGWRTVAFSNNPFLSPQYGLDRGFERYVSYQYNAVAGVELARKWIAEQDRPWLCVLHLMDPHVPYAPPEPWDTRFNPVPLAQHVNWPPKLDDVRKTTNPDEAMKQYLVDLYDAEIAFADDRLGALLDELDSKGVLRDTIVVFHSDHGEEFWDHGGFEHGHTQYQELLHVPLILAYDGHLPRGERVKERVRTMDLFPTLLELAGIAVPADLDARSLMPLVAPNATRDARDAFCEFVLTGEHEVKARLAGSEKLITGKPSGDELYDLAIDPRELHNLLADPARAGSVSRARSAIGEHQQRTLREMPASVHVRLSQGDIVRMNDSGYAGGDVDEPAKTPAPHKEP